MDIGLGADHQINKKFLSPDALAKFLSVSRATVYRLVESRQMPFYKIGGGLRFLQSDVDEYLERSRFEPISKM